MNLLFCTTNQHKITQANLSLKPHGIEIESFSIEVDEIQSEDASYVSRSKAQAIYKAVKKPLIVSDDSWYIPALNNFPGAYMKSMNEWLEPEDWLALMSRHDDRRIFLERNLAYIDENGVTQFKSQEEFYFLDNASQKDGISHMRVIARPGSTKPLNETWLKPQNQISDQAAAVWNDFAKWYKNRTS